MLVFLVFSLSVIVISIITWAISNCVGSGFGLVTSILFFFSGVVLSLIQLGTPRVGLGIICYILLIPVTCLIPFLIFKVSREKESAKIPLENVKLILESVFAGRTPFVTKDNFCLWVKGYNSYLAKVEDYQVRVDEVEVDFSLIDFYRFLFWFDKLVRNSLREEKKEKAEIALQKLEKRMELLTSEEKE